VIAKVDEDNFISVRQLHWRNELLSEDHVDASGIMMYYRDSGEVSRKSLATADRPLKSTAMALLIVCLHFLYTQCI